MTPPSQDQAQTQAPQPRPVPLQTLRRRLGLLRWLVPAGLVVLVIAYEFGPASWIQRAFGGGYQIWADAVLFGTVGPALAFVLLDFLRRWLEERETSDLQAQILARAREDAKNSRRLSDEALQALFAAGVLIRSLESSHARLDPESASRLEDAERTLHQAIERLRTHLLS
jgi:hypothetical protein